MASKGPSASASPENSSAGGPSGSSNGAGESGGQDSTFECNICLDTAKDAVISLCGHLFWSVPLPFFWGTRAKFKKLVALDSFAAFWVLIYLGPKAGDLGSHPCHAADKLSDLGQVLSPPWAPCPHR